MVTGKNERRYNVGRYQGKILIQSNILNCRKLFSEKRMEHLKEFFRYFCYYNFYINMSMSNHTLYCFY